MIVEKVDKYIESKIKQWAHPTNRASEAGHECIRYLVLCRLHNDKKVLHGKELQYIFEEGKLHEQAVLKLLQECGYEIVEQQRPFEWKKFQLSGHIDAKIKINGELWPLEIKTCSPNIFRTIKNISIQDMTKSKFHWIRNYPAQMMLYLLMDGKEKGIILFKNKLTGQLNEKIVYLDYEYTEEILKKLEKVNEYVVKEELPPVEPKEVCKSCGFAKTMCFPDKEYGPGFEIFTDEELILKLERWKELKESAKEFQELDSELKEIFRGKNLIIGDFKIESREFERTVYEIPQDVKSQYVKKMKYWKTIIEEL